MSRADKTCVELLQWALPHLRMRWAGFRKVHRQVCKRVRRRMRALDIDTMAAYQRYLETHPDALIRGKAGANSQ